MSSLNAVAALQHARARGQDPRRIFTDLQFQKVDNNKYLGVIPKDRDGLLELKVAFPRTEEYKVRIDQADPTTKSKLCEIKMAYEVWIEPDKDYVTIVGESKENLKSALTALQAYIRSINKEVEGRMICLIEPSIAASRLPVEIKSINSDRQPYRPVTKELCEEETECLEKHEESTGEHKSLVDMFHGAIRDAAHRIRTVDGQLRVRVHMGIFSLKRRRANQDTFYDEGDLEKLLQKISDKGWSYVGHKIGDETFAQRILNVIYQTEDLSDLDACRFMGASATILSIRDIKPKYCLVLFAKDLKFEVDIKYEPLYQDDAMAENIRSFSCARRDKVVEVAVSCPDRSFDWHLSVEAEANGSRIPPEIRTFVQRGLKFKPPASETDFLVTATDNILRRDADIVEIACKVSWTFELTQKPYRLEVSVYHEWSPGVFQTPGQQWRILNTAVVPGPIKSCGIMMYSPEWDEKMREINDMGAGQANFATGFPHIFPEGNSASGIESFLQEVQGLHEFTELATVPDQR